jgi:anaerobic magnesium-protoporphyrin IX monomethyl ester cyclase
LPGTGFYETVREELGVQQNWVDSNDLAMLYSGPFSTDFYRQLHRTIHTEYRGRRALEQLKKGRIKRLPDLVRAVALPLERKRLQRMR